MKNPTIESEIKPGDTFYTAKMGMATITALRWTCKDIVIGDMLKDGTVKGYLTCNEDQDKRFPQPFSFMECHTTAQAAKRQYFELIERSSFDKKGRKK